MIVKNDFPILEYCTEKEAVINPWREGGRFPRLCLATFFEEVLKEFTEKYQGKIIGTYVSEMKDFHVYRLNWDGIEICAVQAVVASGSIAMMTDWLYGHGVEVIVCCGGCGVLDEIPAGDVIIPVRALRDEGASYKYLAPSRYIDVSEAPLNAFRSVLKKHGIPYLECMTWTTDGFYRETKDMVEYRREEGCKVVEMECATMAAIARFRGKVFGQLLYSGDILVGREEYDERNWNTNFTAREKLFYAALESLCLL